MILCRMPDAPAFVSDKHLVKDVHCNYSFSHNYLKKITPTIIVRKAILLNNASFIHIVRNSDASSLLVKSEIIKKNIR